MAKIKVLVVPSDRTGVSYFRSTIPHIKLEEYFSDEFHVDIDYEPQLYNDDFLKQYDIIHYHRTLGDYERINEVLDRCDKLGVATIMDIDDYWSPENLSARLDETATTVRDEILEQLTKKQSSVVQDSLRAANEKMKQLGFEVMHVYGLTETYGHVTQCAWNDAWNDFDED